MTNKVDEAVQAARQSYADECAKRGVSPDAGLLRTASLDAAVTVTHRDILTSAWYLSGDLDDRDRIVILASALVSLLPNGEADEKAAAPRKPRTKKEA